MSLRLEGTAGGKDFLIRPVARGREEEAILGVYQQCEDFLALGPAAQASREMVAADLAHSLEEGCRFCGIYAAENGDMLGIVDFAPNGYGGEAGKACLALLMIAAPFRGQGLGEAVVWLVEKEMSRAGARVIESGVQVNNPDGIRFWTRMGYRITSGPRDMGDGTTAYELIKTL